MFESGPRLRGQKPADQPHPAPLDSTNNSSQRAGTTQTISSDLQQERTILVKQPATLIASEPPSSATASAKTFSPSYFLQDLTEAIESGLNHTAALYKKIPFSEPLKVSLSVMAGTALATGVVAYPVVAAGAGAICLWQAALRFKQNNHGRAVSILGSTLYTSHMSALGFHEVAFCNFAATTRSIVQSMIADDRPRARIVTALIGFAATASLFSAFTNVFPLFSLKNIPLLTLGIGSASGAFSKEYSWASRVASLTGCGFSIVYHLLVTQSSVGVIASAMFIPGIAWSIWEYDIAKKKQEPST
jgi:hypothetical protein